MQASRLLSILMLLQARGRASAPELARTLEVSERTILRDIDQLSAAGVPVWGERGRNGGFRLREGWSTQLTGLTAQETDALFLAGLPGPATELGLGQAAASARLKLVAGLPQAARAQAERALARLHVDPVDWYRAPDAPRGLREVAQAVWDARVLRMRYAGWNATREHEVEPLGLVLKAGAWYLVARSVRSRHVATYRLANILEMEVGTRAFRRPRGFDLAVYWQQSAARFEAGLRRIEARVRFSTRGMAWAGNDRLAVTWLRTTARGAEAKVWIESIEDGARRLLAFGDEVVVLDPPKLRAELAALAARVHTRHRVKRGRAPRS